MKTATAVTTPRSRTQMGLSRQRPHIQQHLQLPVFSTSFLAQHGIFTDSRGKYHYQQKSLQSISSCKPRCSTRCSTRGLATHIIHLTVQDPQLFGPFASQCLCVAWQGPNTEETAASAAVAPVAPVQLSSSELLSWQTLAHLSLPACITMTL